jgi:hypothetical protein
MIFDFDIWKNNGGHMGTPPPQELPRAPKLGD